MIAWLPLRHNRRPQRLVLLMAVRDEADILADNLRFHFARGVDFAVVADNGSTDGTRDVLEQFRRDGRLAWHDEPDRGYHQSAWMTRLSHEARTKHGADWLLCCDADEFWRPHHGDLKDFVAAQRALVLRCARQNEIAVRSPGREALPFLQQRFAPVLRPRRWRFPCAERAARELSDSAVPGVLLHEEGPKVLARADVVDAITQGSHDIRSSRWLWRARPRDLTIHHFPIRTQSQFAAKVAAGGAAYARTDLPPAVGWHWRHWHACAQAGRLDEAFARETLPDGATLPQIAGVELGAARTAAEALGPGLM
jgi:hypothetical protein